MPLNCMLNLTNQVTPVKHLPTVTCHYYSKKTLDFRLYFAIIVKYKNVGVNMQKLISNREVFRQLLVRDIVAIIEELNAGTWCDLVTIKDKLQNALADRHYYNLHTSRGWGYLDFNDRFYRAIQSVNDKGYGIKVLKCKRSGRLFVFTDAYLTADRFNEFVALNLFDKWDADYNMNAGYRISTELDEVA